MSDASNRASEVVAEGFLDDLKERVHGGLAERFRAGYHAGGTLYGYRTVPILDPSGAMGPFNQPKVLGPLPERKPQNPIPVSDARCVSPHSPSRQNPSIGFAYQSRPRHD
jgi:hypothetical protein